MKNDKKIPVAILGVTGYAGESALQILRKHPNVEIVHAGSDRLAGKSIGDEIPALHGVTDIVMKEDSAENLLASGASVIFLAKKSPEITEIVPKLIEKGVKIIDIGAEFRMRDIEDYEKHYGYGHECPELTTDAVYGLSEIRKDEVKKAQIIGNPGCYPTSVLLPLIPLLKDSLIDTKTQIVSVSYSGLSGAGKRFVEGNNNLFYSKNENLHSYRALTHQHVAEMDQELSDAAGEPIHIHFVPHLAPITQGIHSTISLAVKPGIQLADIFTSWEKQYNESPFIRIRRAPQEVEVSSVRDTNFCDFSGEIDGKTLIITCTIDNLIKGAAGQAVQNFNILFGFDEKTGLI